MFILFLPLTLGVMQGIPAPRLEITGVNASQLPTVTITANVYDNVNQPITNLTAANFSIVGELAPLAQIVSVVNISDQNLPIATVLVIDISTSMEGAPYFAAIEAARTFVQNIGANDPVAIVTFSSGVSVYQPYTTDKNVLLAAIDQLPLGGETALYQGAYEGVLLAAEAPVSRRAVVLLSDGAEYGGASSVGRNAALEEAITRGVPVYTIGLGFGTDRTFLEELSLGTNARAYESPAPEQLNSIYAELAALLRSQYVITLNLNVPADGTEYIVSLQVLTEGGSSVADASLVTPIPVPVIGLSLPTDPISTTTQINASISADDAIQSVGFSVDGTDKGALLDAEPYTFTINPQEYAPGTYTLNVSALDSTGDTGAATGTFTIAALPPTFAFAPDISTLGTLTESQTVIFEVGGQTAPANVSLQFDDGAPLPLEAPYSFIIDPSQFSPGEHRITVSATNTGGMTSTAPGTFNAAALPPAVVINGLQDGQTVDRPIDLSVTVQGQVPVSQVTVTVGGLTLEPIAENSYRIDPLNLQPGGNTVTASAILENGQNASTRLNVLVSALPPRVIVNGLTAGETLDANRDIQIAFESQTPVIHAGVFIDSVDLGHFMTVPISTTLDVLQLGAGDHVIRIVADNASGQSATLDVPFSVSEAPIATATQVANATATSVQATQLVQATAAAVQATEFALATGTVVQATSNAVSTINAQATLVIEATATQAAVITATQQAAATATQFAFVQLTQQRSFEQTSTQAAFDSEATLVANSTISAAATGFSAATSTQIAVVTQGAISTGRAQANETQSAIITATQAANSTATESANINATAIVAATATQAANITATEQANATAIINATATQAANITATERAGVGATQTQIVGQTATQAVDNATATRNANITATGIANATATQVANLEQIAAATQTQVAGQTATQAVDNATATQNANITATEIANATATQVANLEQIAAATQTQVAGQTATQAVDNATATRNANITATEIANATATQVANLEQIAAAATQTQVAGQTATQAVGNATATSNADALIITQAFEATSTQGALNTATAQNTIDARETARAQIASTNQVQTRSALETRAAQTRFEVQLTQDARATRDTDATATQASFNALATAAQLTRDAATATTARQFAIETQNALDASATAVQQTATAQQANLDANATATQAAINGAQTVTQVALEVHATQTQAAINALQATQTEIITRATATQAAQQTQGAVQTDTFQQLQVAQAATATEIISNATETQSALNFTATALVEGATATQAAMVQTMTEVARALNATDQANLAATQRASILGTDTAATSTAAQATTNADATNTTSAQATNDTRLTAIGPTSTPIGGTAQVAQASTSTPGGSPVPTTTLVPIETDSTPISSSTISILIITLVVIILLAVAFLVLRRRT